MQLYNSFVLAIICYELKVYMCVCVCVYIYIYMYRPAVSDIVTYLVGCPSEHENLVLVLCCNFIPSTRLRNNRITERSIVNVDLKIVCRKSFLDLIRRKGVYSHLQMSRAVFSRTAQCYMHSAICTVLYTQCYMHSAICAVPYAQCYMHSAICTVPYAQCYMHSAICTVLYAQCYMHRAICTVLVP
jgi:hypothetical protein